MSPADVSESIFGDFTEDIDTAESGDIEIDDITPPTMVNSIITWGDIRGEESVSLVTKPKVGGIFVDETITDNENWILIHFVRTDPDATTNV